jgi:hypothetical protein
MKVDYGAHVARLQLHSFIPKDFFREDDLLTFFKHSSLPQRMRSNQPGIIGSLVKSPDRSDQRVAPLGRVNCAIDVVTRTIWCFDCPDYFVGFHLKLECLSRVFPRFEFKAEPGKEERLAAAPGVGFRQQVPANFSLSTDACSALGRSTLRILELRA